MIGRRFGKLVVMSKASSNNGVIWLCRCDCGNTKTARTGHLNAGSPRSCGCDVFHGHGGSGGRKSREYITYHNMMARCHKPSNKRYEDYGGKGIDVCLRWRESFHNFIEDMGPCPKGYQIDRINNNLGYFHSNCRWASRKENMRNRPNTYLWNVQGSWYESAQEAADHHGVSPHTIRAWCCGRRVGGRYYPAKPSCHREERYSA